jgi:hypothetical protein
MAKKELFPALSFTSSVLSGVGVSDSASVPLAGGGCGSITLVCGDLFVALEHFVSLPFDIVYDRHSFGAISPDMRPRYARAVSSVLRQAARPGLLPPHAALYFMQVAHRRDASLSAGPPFHISVDEVQMHFSNGAVKGIEWSYGLVPSFSEGEQVGVMLQQVFCVALLI